MWWGELSGGPLDGERVRLAEAFRVVALPLPRVRGWPCEFALYELERVEASAGVHRYRFDRMRASTYAERILFDGGAHAWE